jgi:nucleotide-binding universal stress UspA family protein
LQQDSGNGSRRDRGNMELRAILVAVDIDSYSSTLVRCAVSLASRFGAALIGHASAEPASAMTRFETGAFAADLYERERKNIEERLADVERRFRADAGPDLAIDWRSSLEAPNLSLRRTARLADLVLIESNFEGPPRSPLRFTEVGELLVSAGRPVLVTGAGLTDISGNSVVVGWKDSREARRAVADALPLLKAARQVVVATIREDDADSEESSLNDVLGWMERHGIGARGKVHPAAERPAEALESIAREHEADLVVMGGYGRSRMREWLFGGMTRDLLTNRTVHRFMSN